MIDQDVLYQCASCEATEYSNVGNPYSWITKIDKCLCQNCEDAYYRRERELKEKWVAGEETELY